MPPREAIDEKLEVVVSDSPIAVRRRRLTPTPNCHSLMFTEYSFNQRRLKRSMTSDLGGSSGNWIMRCWQLHFGISLSILIIGFLANQPSSKYIPIDPSLIGDECERAFLNAMSSTMDDPNAIICCHPLSSHGVCNKTTFPLGSRLSRFPEAWLLPLFPLILRWIVNRWNGTIQNTTTTVRRLVLYLTMMLVRGVVLYRGMNQLEKYLHSTDDSCWYQDWLREDQPTCYGRLFDFSDHVVLYMAQILPICLAETLEGIQQQQSMNVPPRRIMSTQTISLLTSMNGGVNPEMSEDSSFSSSSSLSQTRSSLFQPVDIMIVIWTLYMYWITLWSSFRTTLYFHTGAEVLIGFAVSLLLQWPLYRLQCYPSESFRHVQEWFFIGTKQ